MLYKPTERASGLTMALTGMGVAVGIAREATDAVPIVKQCLGSAVRIVAFAEKIDKDRQALHELADKSLQLARRVKEVMDGRKPDAKVETSPERILKALESIETFMQKHSARSRVYRLIGYAFTVPQHVERLSRELADAVQELIVVVLLDVNHHVDATHIAVDENARFAGEFRLLRHCEVQKLDRIFDSEDREDSTALYHRAQVDGQLLVVRYFEGSTSQPSHSDQESEETIFNCIAYHDCILEEISTVQRSHRNVARIYGWSRGCARDRFTVFKAGYQPVESLLGEFPNPIVTGIHWALKVLDAVRHLQLLGILWDPGHPVYVLDDQLEPIIGLQNDLYRMNQNRDPLFDAHYQLFKMTWPLWSCAERKSVQAAEIPKLLAGCLDERLADLLGRLETIRRARCIIPKAEFSHRRILTDTAAEGLVRVLEGEVLDEGWRDLSWPWAKIFLALDKNRSHPLMRSLLVVHHARKTTRDWICIYGIDDDSECFVHDKYIFGVSVEQLDEVRRMFNISAPAEEYCTYHRIATGTYRMLLD